MKSPMNAYLKPLAIAATLAVGSTLAAAVAAAPPGTAAPAGDPPPQRPERCAHGGAGVHAAQGMRHGAPIWRELRALDLSPEQRQSIGTLLGEQREQQRQWRQRERTIDTGLAALDPAARDYKSRTRTLADQAGALARERVEARAALQARLQAQLTPEQIKLLQQHRAERAAQRAESYKQRERQQPAEGAAGRAP